MNFHDFDIPTLTRNHKQSNQDDNQGKHRYGSNPAR